MGMKAAARWGILGVIFLGTLVAAAFAPDQEPAVPSAKAKRVTGPRQAVVSNGPRSQEVVGSTVHAPVTPALGFPVRAPLADGDAGTDLFAAKSWYVAPPPPPPPPPVVALPPPKPVAPALPFTYMGRLGGAPGEAVVYLVKGDRTFPVKGGETLEGVYRVEKIEAAQVEFTYLPLNEKQVLLIGAPR